MKNQTNHNPIIHNTKIPTFSTSTVTPMTALQLWKQEGSWENHNGNDHNNCLGSNPRVSMPPNVPILLSPLSLSSSTHVSKDENKKLWLELKGRNGIIEISGEAGSGKTQLCLSLVLNTIMIKIHNTGSNPITIVNTSTCSSKTQQHHPNVNKRPYSLISNKHHDTTMSKTVVYHALYICLGETTSTSQIAHRLHQMVRERIQLQVYPPQDRSISLEEYIQDVMRRIHIKCIHNTEDFISFVQNELDTMLSVPRETNHSSVGLIVLDSIAGLYRIPEEEDKEQNFRSKYYVRRSETFFDVASKLKYLSDTYGVHMVVVNQVTGRGNGKHIPSLGLSWSHCVNERYHLSRKERISATAANHHSNTTGKEGNGDDENPTIPKGLFERSISLIASSKRNINVSTKFRITTFGVYECS